MLKLYRNKSGQMPYRIVLDMDDDIVALVQKKHTDSRMLPSLWKAVGVSDSQSGVYLY